MSINQDHLYKLTRNCITSPTSLLLKNGKEIAQNFKKFWSIGDDDNEKNDLVEQVYIPLIIKEKNLERESIVESVSKFRKKIQEARESNKDLIQIEPEFEIMINTVPHIGGKIMEILKPNRHRPHKAKNLLKKILYLYEKTDGQIDVQGMIEELAFIALHYCFNNCYYRGDPLQNTLTEIGKKVQQYLESAWYLNDEEKYFYKIEEIKEREREDNGPIGLLSSLERKGKYDLDWSEDDQFSVGNLLVTALSETNTFTEL